MMINLIFYYLGNLFMSKVMKCSIIVKNRKCKLPPVYHNPITKVTLCRIHFQQTDSEFVIIGPTTTTTLDNDWMLINF